MASTSTFSFDRTREHSTVVDNTRGLVYSGSVLNRLANPKKQQWANCEISLVDEQPPTIFSFIEQQGWAPVYAGGKAVNGVPARHFKFSNGGAASPYVDYYDDAATHAPLRVAVSVGQTLRMFIDISNFTALTQSPGVSWHGPLPDETSGDWGTSCPGAVVVPAGAALYPNAAPLGFTTSFLAPTVVLSSSSSSSSSTDISYSQFGRRKLLELARPRPFTIIRPPPSPPPTPPPSPPTPPSPPPPQPPPPPPSPPPCPNPSTSTWRVCYSDGSGCTLITITACQSITDFNVSGNIANATQTSGRHLLQTDVGFFLGKMAARYDAYQKKVTSISSDTVKVDLTFSRWPAAGKSACMAYYKTSTCNSTCQVSQCTKLALKLGSNGTVALNPAYGNLTLPAGYRNINDVVTPSYSNSTFIGLTGGESMYIAPPQPGFPFNSSQIPITCTKTICFVARVWWFVDGDYKQARCLCAVRLLARLGLVSDAIYSSARRTCSSLFTSLRRFLAPAQEASAVPF